MPSARVTVTVPLPKIVPTNPAVVVRSISLTVPVPDSSLTAVVVLPVPALSTAVGFVTVWLKPGASLAGDTLTPNVVSADQVLLASANVLLMSASSSKACALSATRTVRPPVGVPL